MAVNRKFLATPQPARQPPIQFLTENGFHIIRRCDVDDSYPKDGIEHCFVARDPDGYELDIIVRFDTRAAAEVIERSCRRVSFESSFWVSAAERHLSEYLSDHNDYPPNAELKITELTLDDIDLARRWDGDGA